MPVYEYECPACEKVFEVQQRMSDDPLSSCPDCGGKVKKLVSMSSFHLKGGGWYSDGYSADGGNDKAKKKAPAKSADAAPPCKKGGDGGGCKKCPAAG